MTNLMTLNDVLKILAERKTDIERLGVKSLAIFGSTARNEAAAGSDVDLLVEFAEPVGLFKFLEVKAYLESILGREVDLATPDALKRRVRQRILREAIRAL